MNKYNSRSILLFFIIGLLSTIFASAVVNAGPLDNWTLRHSKSDVSLNGVAYGNGLLQLWEEFHSVQVISV